MAVYKLSSSQFSLVEQSEFVGDENRLFYTVDGTNVSFYLGDGVTPGGFPITVGGGISNPQTLALNGTNLTISGGNTVDLSSIDTTVDLTGYATEVYVDNAIAAIPPVDLTGYATETFVNTAISNLIDGAGATLDTLNELAASIGNDPDFAGTMYAALADKVGYADFETQFDINLATVTTDEVAEGTTNLYYTDARAQAANTTAINNAITTANAYTDSEIATLTTYIDSQDTSILNQATSYTDTTINNLTTDDITEGTTNLYYSDTYVENYINNNPNTGTDWQFNSIQLLGGDSTQGIMTWNVDEETVDLTLNGATLQLGQETHIHVRNGTAGTIANGTALMAIGTLGASGRIVVAPMIADGSVQPRYFLGVATEDIPANTDGKLTVFGKIRGINTSLWSEGDVLWCDPVVPGNLTVTQPEAPNLKIATAFVISSGNNGTLFIRANGGIDLHNNHRVEIVNSDTFGNPTVDNSVLMWNNTTTRWENRTPTEHLADVGLTNAIVSGDNVSELVNDANYIATDDNAQLSSLTITGDLYVSGTTFTVDATTIAGPLTVEQVNEPIQTVAVASAGPIVFDTVNGQLFYVNLPAIDWTMNITNLSALANHATNVTTVIQQGAVAYIPTALQIGGASVTINWQGGAQPLGTNNGIDTVNFSIMNIGGSYLVLGQLVDF